MLHCLVVWEALSPWEALAASPCLIVWVRICYCPPDLTSLISLACGHWSHDATSPSQRAHLPSDFLISFNELYARILCFQMGPYVELLGLKANNTNFGGCNSTHNTAPPVRMGFYALDPLSSLLLSNMILGPFSPLLLSLLLWLCSWSVSELEFMLGGLLVRNGSNEASNWKHKRKLFEMDYRISYWQHWLS